MSRLGAEPRINGRLFKDFTGQTVRLVVKVIQITGDKATVETSDGMQIGLLLGRDIHIQDAYVEVIGSVKEEGTVRALSVINLGKDLDMKAVNNVIEFANSSKGEGVLA